MHDKGTVGCLCTEVSAGRSRRYGRCRPGWSRRPQRRRPVLRAVAAPGAAPFAQTFYIQDSEHVPGTAGAITLANIKTALDAASTTLAGPARRSSTPPNWRRSTPGIVGADKFGRSRPCPDAVLAAGVATSRGDPCRKAGRCDGCRLR